MNTKFYCIGDSHISVFLGKDMLAPYWPENTPSLLPFFEVFRLGPITAYNLINPNSSTQGRLKFEEVLKTIPPNSWLVVSAGEIDCRVHLVKQAEKQNKSYQQLAQVVAEKYFEYIKTLIKRNYKVCIMMPPPTGYKLEDDPEYPKYGSEVERNRMTLALIDALKQNCSANSIPFIGIFEHAIAKSFYTKKTYLWDKVHPGTFACRLLVEQLELITGEKLKIPLSWFTREAFRKIKRVCTILFQTNEKAISNRVIRFNRIRSLHFFRTKWLGNSWY